MERLFQSRRLSRFSRRFNHQITEKDILRGGFLTQRDKDVLLSIYRHRCLTTEQLTEMHFRFRSDDLSKENSHAPTVARRRIRKLFDYQLIDRFFVDVGPNNGSSQAHIVLDQLGAKIVGGILNIPYTDLKWRYQMNRARLPYLEHMVEVNEFYLHLLRRSRQLGHELGPYFTENLTRFEFMHDGKRVVLNPDAYGSYYTGSNGFHFFLERDRGTMALSAFREKQKRYASFLNSGSFMEYYQTFPLVLTVTSSWDRALALRDTVYSANNDGIQWLFTSEDLTRQDVLAPIWLGHEDEPVSLLSFS